MKITLTVGKLTFNIPAWLFWPWLAVACYIGVRYLVIDLWKMGTWMSGGIG